MSLRFRLIALVCLALVVSLALGGVTAWVNASRSVRNEMRSALMFGRQTIESGIERLQQAADPSRGLDELVASFEGNRHLRVRFAGLAEAVATPVVESPPFGAVPNWFVRIIRVAPVTDRVPITVGGRDYGTIALETDPHNEILEVWNEFTDSLVTPAVFSSLTILLIYLFIGRALRPLEALAKALEQVDEGRYRTRFGGRLAPELARLRDSFNRTAARLAVADAEALERAAADLTGARTQRTRPRSARRSEPISVRHQHRRCNRFAHAEGRPHGRSARSCPVDRRRHSPYAAAGAEHAQPVASDGIR